jgi:hypothetical protein
MTETTETILVGCITIAIGIYCICAAIFNWNWFFNNSRADLFMTLFKRKGARIAYAIIGLIFAVIGVLALISKFIS